MSKEVNKKGSKERIYIIPESKKESEPRSPYGIRGTRRVSAEAVNNRSSQHNSTTKIASDK